MLEIAIRQMEISDYDDVYALWMSCPGMGLNNIDDSYEGISAFISRNPTSCFVADNQGIIGVIMAGHDGRRGYIYHTAVAPVYQGRGVGTALVDACLQALSEEGISKVALVVFADNSAGNAFWDKVGFHSREDLVYRNKSLENMVRIDT